MPSDSARNRLEREWPMTFKVLVDDNFHYMDESARYELGEFPTLEAAIEASRRIVDEYLRSAYQPGMTTDALLTSYLLFGEDPFILAPGSAKPGVLFSARDYARRRCEEMCPSAGHQSP
jgi:hypothetical protein